MQTDVAQASRDGNLYRAFDTIAIAAGVTVNLVLDIPVGVDVFGFSRFTEVAGGTCQGQFFMVSGFTSSSEIMAGLNFDQREDNGHPSLSKLHRASAVAGEVAFGPLNEFFVGTSAAARAPASQTEAGAQPSLDHSSLACFRYTNTSNDTASLNMLLFFQELPNGKIS